MRGTIYGYAEAHLAQYFKLYHDDHADWMKALDGGGKWVFLGNFMVRTSTSSVSYY